ncbi:MAG: hypothetical protein IPI65_16455 [Bacteroidetes bacterium]|nr:hypothetical protein [Bacteroidota bacterium]
MHKTLDVAGWCYCNSIDGWRLDVAFCVDHDFWKSWRIHVKSINPEAYLTAEVVDKPKLENPIYTEMNLMLNELWICRNCTSEFLLITIIEYQFPQFDSLLSQLVPLWL